MRATRRKLWGALSVALVILAGGAFAARNIIKRALPSVVESLAPVATGPRVARPLEAAETIYDQSLSSGWSDWGWGPHQLGNGPAKIVFASYGGLLVHHTELAWRYGGLAFRFRAPSSWGDFLHVALRRSGKPDDTFPTVKVEARHIADVDGGWREVLVDWKELNPERRAFDGVLIGSRAQVGPEWAELDHVILTKAEASDTQQGTLSVLCDGNSRPISELIYGASADFWKSGQTAKRIGGNPLSRANWELGAWNTGSDWFFENVSPEQTVFQVLEAASKEKWPIAMVIPMVGWVAKDKTSVGFPREKFPNQRNFDQYRTHAGDGFTSDGKPLRPGDPRETSVEAPPELVAAWIRKVREQDARLGARSIHQYILDNEPTLWNVTHRDVHPDPLSYDELLDRTVRYASAVRQADPEAVIAGPAEWGHTGYEFSAVDREAGPSRPDRRAHGDVPLVAWYLKELAARQKATGVRLLDVFDLHFYPQAENIYGGNARTDPEGADLRLRSTRALWDPDYVDESWINEKQRLIPRMQQWVDQNYPGLKLSLGEWSFGAQKHISGGLATAEALGRFGQQGLYSAFLWDDLDEGTPGYWAFRAFRNFDGRGARFQDISVPTREMGTVSLFASRNAESTRLVLVVINISQTIKVAARIGLQGCGRARSVRRFEYTANSNGLAEHPSQVVADELSVELEPFSLGVLDVTLDKSADG